MKQSPDQRPIPSLQRKAAIARGAATDHAGSVWVEPIEDFDLDRTIFSTLKGALPRYVMRTRVAKEVHWKEAVAERVREEYESSPLELPEIAPELLRFMVEECDFDVEHADGSFLDHLYFGFEYCARHYPEGSPLVMLLHSILGTGTNTFAMEATKIPQLRALLNQEEWRHVEAFPSILRLLYDRELRKELEDNRDRLSSLSGIRFHRVIDNAPLSLTGEELWMQLNFQLIHLIDFLPVANWGMHASDTSFIVFRALYQLLESSGHRVARLQYSPVGKGRSRTGEQQSFPAWLTTLVPVPLSEKMAAAAVRRFSKQIGHSMDYQLEWKA